MSDDHRDPAAVALGRRGGHALRASWDELRARAQAGDTAAQKELTKRLQTMKRRGKKGGRPKKKAT